MADSQQIESDKKELFHKNMVKLFGDSYDWCIKYAKYHRRYALCSFIFMSVIFGVIICTTIYFFLAPEHFKNADSKSFVYIFYVVAAPVFGILITLYKFHIKEVANYQHFHLGFKRTFIAGSSHDEGFGTEVRVSLTKNAFPTLENDQSKKNTEKNTRRKKKAEKAADEKDSE